VEQERERDGSVDFNDLGGFDSITLAGTKLLVGTFGSLGPSDADFAWDLDRLRTVPGRPGGPVLLFVVVDDLEDFAPDLDPFLGSKRLGLMNVSPPRRMIGLGNILWLVLGEAKDLAHDVVMTPVKQPSGALLVLLKPLLELLGVLPFGLSFRLELGA